jgi:hypothetical protein
LTLHAFKMISELHSIISGNIREIFASPAALADSHGLEPGGAGTHAHPHAWLSTCLGAMVCMIAASFPIDMVPSGHIVSGQLLAESLL